MSTIRPLAFGLLATCLVLGLAAPVLAHVPAFGAANDDPGNATVVPDPTKSWAFYDRVAADGAVYYEATFLDGERLSLTGYASRRGLQPGLVVMTPGGVVEDGVPAAVEVPDGYGATVVEPERADGAEFEPFTPGAYFYTVDLDRQVEGGQYLVAVYDGRGRAGPVGLAIGGNEQFTPVEYLTVPVDALAIHAWEGDSPVLVFGPGVVVALAGVVFLWRRLAADGGDDRGVERRLTRWALALSAVTILGTTAMLATQLGIALAMTGPTAAALVTLVLVLLPVAIATYLWRVATGSTFDLTRRRRAGLALAGVGALATWGGLLVAPLVPIAVALVPASLLR